MGIGHSTEEFLDDIGCFGRHTERPFGLLIGDVAAPGDGLAVQVIEVLEVASAKLFSMVANGAQFSA